MDSDWIDFWHSAAAHEKQESDQATRKLNDAQQINALIQMKR